MLEQTPGELRLVAVTNVAVDGAQHASGAVFTASRAIADELVELSAARAWDEDEDAGGGDIETVKGIGPKTAKALRALGVTGLDDLASLPDEALPKLAEVVDKDADTVAGWRAQARELTAP